MDKLVFFGAGLEATRALCSSVRKPEYFIDNNPKLQGCFLQRIPIFLPEKLLEEDKDALTIVITSSYFDEIARQLESMGFLYGLHFFRASEYPLNGLDFAYIELGHVCNLRCVMCGIWREHSVLSKEDLDTYLQDPLFANVKGVYIQGGEPTLFDLAGYADIMIGRLPLMNRVVMSTNGYLGNKAAAIIHKLYDKLKPHGIVLELSISIDGPREVHDKIRGRAGSYDKAIETLNELTEKGVNPLVATTISASNLWDMDRWLGELNDMPVPFIFNIAQLGKRLVNMDYTGSVESFSQDELYKLQLFVFKLIYNGWRYPKLLNGVAYQNAFEILSGKPRRLACGFKNQDVFLLTHGGKIGACSAFEPSKASLKEQPGGGFQTYNKMSQQLRLNGFTRCETCMRHMLQKGGTGMDARGAQEIEEDYFKRLYTINAYFNSHDAISLDEAELFGADGYSIMITGWYGTETVGDKAILGEIIHSYRERYGEIKIYVTSMYPFITERTIYELGACAEVLPLYSRESLLRAASVDEVVIGGGPLMDLDILGIPLWLFDIAKKHGRKTVVCGCGIGPLTTENGVKAVKEILRIADDISLRDSDSAKWAKGAVGRDDIRVVGDPAAGYLKRRFPGDNPAEKEKTLACFLRRPTDEYKGGMTNGEYSEYLSEAEAALAENIKRLCLAKNLTPKFYSMHNFAVGGDDQDFNIEFTKRYFSGTEYWVDDGLTTIEKIVSVMRSAEYCLCMRFHSLIFADTLGANYAALDYTGGGKIAGFLSDKGKPERKLSFDDIRQNRDALLEVFDGQM